jgi:hypothetical protein
MALECSKDESPPAYVIESQNNYPSSIDSITTNDPVLQEFLFLSSFQNSTYPVITCVKTRKHISTEFPRLGYFPAGELTPEPPRQDSEFAGIASSSAEAEMAV